MSRSSNRKHLSPADRETLAQMYGTKCYVCGREEEIEWHHVKPLWMGGEDTFENMIPVCYTCHKELSRRTPKEAKRLKAHKKLGRPRKIPKNCDAVLGGYIRCEFGTKECMKRLGLTKGSHVSDCTWYKEYLEKHGIESFRNNVDLRLSKSGIVLKGNAIGKIKYREDEETQIIYAPCDILTGKAAQMEFNFNAGSQPTKANEYRAAIKQKPKAKPKARDIYDIDSEWWRDCVSEEFIQAMVAGK